MATAFRNPDQSIAVVVFNLTEEDVTYDLVHEGQTVKVCIKGQALQTVVLR
jgi:hypothetical protein